MAIRTISNTGGNWNLTSTWVEGVVPTSSDDVVCTATSGNVTVTSGAACASIDFTNYVGTITMSNVLTIGGNITLSTGMTINGISQMSILSTATSTVTTNGKAFKSFAISSICNVTLADDVIVLNNFNLGNSTVNGFSITVGGNFTKNNTGINLGTTTYTMNGTGNLTCSSTGALTGIFSINTTGTTTVTGTLRYQSGTFTHSAGTVNTASSSIICQASTNWNCSGITWNNFAVQGGTQTLISDLNVGGNFSSSNPVVYNGADLIISGGMNIFQRIDGTSTLRYKGTGTWSQQGPVNMNMIIDTTGTLTLNGTVAAANLTYSAGTVVTAGSTLINGGNLSSYNYSTSGITFNNVLFSLGTINLNQTFNASGLLTVGSSNTTSFDGNYGFNVGTFRCLVPGRLTTLKTGNTYNCDNLQLIGTNAARVFLRSSVANNYTYFNLTPGGTCDVKWCNPTDIDSSGGRLITDVKGTLTRTINWYQTNPDYFAFF